MRQEIADLEAITNRTAEQEQKLKELKDKLAKLEQGSSDGGGGDPKKPTNYWLWIIVVIVVLLVIGIIVYFLTRNKQDKNH